MTPPARRSYALVAAAVFAGGVLAGFLHYDSEPLFAIGTLLTLGLVSGAAGWASRPIGAVAAMLALVPVAGLPLHAWFC